MYFENLTVVQDYPSPDGIWELVEKIGEGNYGVVYKGRNKKTGQIGAVKIMDATLDKEEDITSEVNVFLNSNHENIIKCYGIYLKKQEGTNDQLWIVMEYCAGGCVTDLIKNLKEKDESLSEDLIAYILREILNGIAHLHGKKLLHRDIKGQNVMITQDGRIRLIDFGIAASVDWSYGRRTTAIGTPYWMSPEVIACEYQLDSDYDMRTDIWSLGITAIEVVDSVPPLFGENPLRALYKIPKNPPPKFENPNRWSRQLNDFVAKCLVKDFEKRPNATQLLQHEFLQFVPKDPRVLRRKLMGLLDISAADTIDGAGASQSSLNHTHSGRSSHTSTGLDTAQRNLMAVRTLDLEDDLAKLEYIDESILVGQLMKRYKKGLIYTNVGDILVSVNPFQQLDIYTEEISERYDSVTKSSKSSLPPHIYAVAGAAYQGLLREMKNQCCIVSGESGAGKTEASNILVKQFMKLGRSESRALEMKILALNPLLESFGNARTVINSNSSRFGKYLELYFTQEGKVAGARVSEYLLEKSRVIFQSGKERNFHIFYYLLAALTERKQLQKYKLKGTHHHRYLRQVGTSKASGRKNPALVEKFEEVERAFTLFGFSAVEFHQVCQVLSTVLCIGDIKIEEDVSNYHLGEISAIANPLHVMVVGEILGVLDEQLKQVITTTSVITHGDNISRHNTIEQAMDTRDAIAKALYGRLFSWIVNKLNPTMGQSLFRHKKLQSIAILDIFGFENYRSNSFEQLCINITNEQLQFYFNQHVFAWEQEEYEREGIKGADVSYKDNRSLLDLLLKRPMGLLALLDEESKFPRANDLTLAMKFHRHFSPSHDYTEPKDNGGSFIIHHYAGQVEYNTQGFLEKNRDTLKPEVLSLLRESSNPIVRELFCNSISRTGRFQDKSSHKVTISSATPLFSKQAPRKVYSYLGMMSDGSISSTPLSASISGTILKTQTVSSYFYYSLRELIANMLQGTPHFVRCIRPNDLRTPREFHPEKVREQLRYTGVLETIRIRREGFSHRVTFEDFMQRYKLINFPLSLYVAPTAKNCEMILEKIGVEKYAIGKTKVFLKYSHVSTLWDAMDRYHLLAVRIQKAVRGWLVRLEVQRWAELRREAAAVKIQAIVRQFLARRKYQKIFQRRITAVVKLQLALRGHLARVAQERDAKRHSAAIVIQKYTKRLLAMKSYTILKKENEAAIIIQFNYRIHLAYKARKGLLNKIKAAIIIQRNYRKWNAKMKRKTEMASRQVAAYTIQKAVRLWLNKQRLRRERKEIINRRVKAVKVIQQAFRQYQFRLNARKKIQDQLKEKKAHEKFLAAKLIAGGKTVDQQQAATESIRSKLERHVVATMQEMEKRLGVTTGIAANMHPEKIDMTRDPVSVETPARAPQALANPSQQQSQIELKNSAKGMENEMPAKSLHLEGGTNSLSTRKVHKFFEDLIQSKQFESVNKQPAKSARAQKIKKKELKSDVFQKLLERFENS